jgi:hypothetical protein
MTFWESISASALSLVVSGNTGVSPFLSLFIVGICGNVDPTLLNMDETMQTILASWPALILLGMLTLLEFVAKCIPVIDEIVDSALVFVVPLVSILGSLSTFGVLTKVSNGYENLSNLGDTSGRSLQYDAASSSSDSSGGFFVVFLQVVLVVVGIGLSVLIHLFKMIIRLLGEGCLTNCLTILETLWIVLTILLAIYIRPIAIGVAIVLGCAAAFSFKRRIVDKIHKKEEAEAEQQGAQDPTVPMVTMGTKEKSTTAAEGHYVAMKQI